MFDSSVCASSLQVNGMSWADSPVSIDDLAFIELMLTLEASDSAIMDKMREIRALQDRKSAISEEMGEINDLLKASDAEDGDDWVIDQGKNEEAARSRHQNMRMRELEQQQGVVPPENLQEAVDLEGEKMLVDTGVVANPSSTTLGDLDDDQIRDMADGGSEAAKQEATRRGMYKKEDLDSRLDELQREFEDLNKSSELMLIDLNRLMQKRNQAVQLTTNIMQSCHQTAMGVIANFK